MASRSTGEVLGWALFAFALLSISVEARPNSTQPPQHALVIGNAEYARHPLSNPHNDAHLMAATLSQLGYLVTERSDLDKKGFYEAVNGFVSSLPQGAVSLVYYAGHGMQIDGANYLLPVDMQITSEQGTVLRAFPLKAMTEKLQATQSAVNIVILDACRDNPFQPGSRYRGFSQMGLARISSPKGMIVAYSTAPGQQAADGLGTQDSLYTSTLASEITKPGLPIEKILKNVADIVRKKSYDDQQPWFESSLVDDYFFLPPDGTRIVTRAPPLALASKGKRGIRGAESGEPNTTDSSWYLRMNETDWSNLDWEVEQRVKRMSEDEIPLLEYKANNGNVVAQTTLGLLYREGLNRIANVDSNQTFRSNPSNPKSLHWLMMAADAGFPMAQVELGEMYYQGHGVDRNLSLSKQWLQKAARVPYPRAKLDLAQVMTFSTGSSEDMKTLVEGMLQSYTQILQQNTQAGKKSPFGISH